MKWPRVFGRRETRRDKPRSARRYEAATGAHGRFDGGQARFGSYGAETIAANFSLRSRARHAAENDAAAAAAIAAWVDAAIGPGLRPVSQHPDPLIRGELDAGFRDWARRADAAGRSDFWGLQAAVARAERIDGEALLIWQGDQLLHLPPEQLADLSSDRIVAGVELDDAGRPVAYHVHPGGNPMDSAYSAPVRVPASEALHVFEPRGPGQVRGVSALAPVLLLLSELNALEDARLVQQKVAATLAVIATNESDLGVAGDPFPEGQGLTPGAILKLPGSWKISTIAGQQAIGGEEFAARILNRVAAAIGVPAHLITGDVSKANYSSLRAAMVAFRQRIERHQFQVLAPQLLDPIWRRVAQLTALERGLPIDGRLSAVEWIPPAQPWVDPLKDAQATALLMDRGLMSRRQAVAQLGYSIEQLDAEIAADREREAALGLIFSGQSKNKTESNDEQNDND